MVVTMNCSADSANDVAHMQMKRTEANLVAYLGNLLRVNVFSKSLARFISRIAIDHGFVVRDHFQNHLLDNCSVLRGSCGFSS